MSIDVVRLIGIVLVFAISFVMVLSTSYTNLVVDSLVSLC